MTTPALTEVAAYRHDVHDDTEAAGVACLLMAIEMSDVRRFNCRPLAHATGGPHGCQQVAATVMIDVGGGPLPFPLGAVRLAAVCLRADPPFKGAHTIADALDRAADQAEASVIQLLGSLN